MKFRNPIIITLLCFASLSICSSFRGCATVYDMGKMENTGQCTLCYKTDINGNGCGGKIETENCAGIGRVKIGKKKKEFCMLCEKGYALSFTFQNKTIKSTKCVKRTIKRCIMETQLVLGTKTMTSCSVCDNEYNVSDDGKDCEANGKFPAHCQWGAKGNNCAVCKNSYMASDGKCVPWKPYRCGLYIKSKKICAMCAVFFGSFMNARGGCF